MEGWKAGAVGGLELRRALRRVLPTIPQFMLDATHKFMVDIASGVIKSYPSYKAASPGGLTTKAEPPPSDGSRKTKAAGDGGWLRRLVRRRLLTAWH